MNEYMDKLMAQVKLNGKMEVILELMDLMPDSSLGYLQGVYRRIQLEYEELTKEA